MSKRAAEMLRDDLEAKGPVRLSEVEGAGIQFFLSSRQMVANNGSVYLPNMVAALRPTVRWWVLNPPLRLIPMYSIAGPGVQYGISYPNAMLRKGLHVTFFLPMAKCICNFYNALLQAKRENGRRKAIGR